MTKEEFLKLPVWDVQRELDDIRKRLGRIEMHLINIRGSRRPAKPESKEQ
jgi:hypothetical protein